MYILDFIRKIPKLVEERKVILFVIDGLGSSNLNLPFKKVKYKTVFPSSTTNFFYSFHSLLEPKDHGFLEWYMRFKGKPIKVPSWTDLDGNKLKVKREEVFPFRSLSEFLYKKGFSSSYYTPFPDTSFTIFTSKKAEIRGIMHLSEIFPLANSDFLFIYWPSCDDVLHKNYRNESFIIEKKFLEFFIKILYKKIPKNSYLIVTSDHGQTLVKKRYKLPIINTFPVGGSRVAFYKSEEEKVERILRSKRIPAKVYEIDEIYGKVNKRCIENFGNIVVIAKENIGFIYPFEKSKEDIGAHGGISKEEMYVNVYIGKK